MSNIPTLYLPFKTIDELVIKVEKIKSAHLIHQKQFKTQLDNANIKYNVISDYGVSIDISDLSEEQIKVVNDKDTTLIKRIYNDLGVAKSIN